MCYTPHTLTLQHTQWYITSLSQSHPHLAPSHLHSSQSAANQGKLTFGQLLRKASAVDDWRECADYVRLTEHVNPDVNREECTVNK